MQKYVPFILYYDHLMTLSEEITWIWSRPRARSSLLFFLNRYVPLVGHIAVLVYTFGGFTICDKFPGIHSIPSLPDYVQPNSRGQFYSLADTAHYYHLLVCTSNAWGEQWSAITAYTVTSAELAHDRHNHISFPKLSFVAYCLAAPWEMHIVFDVTVFILTTVKWSQHRRDSLAHLDTCEKWSGAMYFCAMGLAELANIFTFYDPLRGTLSTFATCISVTMMSRLILNLHGTSSRLPSSTQATESIVFASRRDTMMHPDDADDDVVHDIGSHRLEHLSQEDVNVCE
ncbi:hypothetical protein HETIRDRAFT_119296 [Heterobasidion irregulare TC 32-1]|uniref:DUF6533 domain-containing protein n=1 Tax=Heterobasidion irregulare (strain TC 32-1) TaxID=747525 RepID=W4JRH3_HETIT|nr:uncharacterized protein HETIRDRAFT_119296 [Heterobasidion irregulare TC 32-1]ETW76064.1 hypothetical protein HETIRDRAFT_119296 [Heterobasidion irregulare TC 32-1]